MNEERTEKCLQQMKLSLHNSAIQYVYQNIYNIANTKFT